MDDFYAEKLRKDIKENQYLRDLCSKVLSNPPSFNQWLMTSKGYFCIEKRIDQISQLLKECINRPKKAESTDCISSEKSSVRIQDIRLPLLWADEVRKRTACTGYAFFTVSWEEFLAETDLIYLDSSSCEIYSPGVKISNVDINTSIFISGYILWFNPAIHTKLPSKSKEMDLNDVCLKFKHLGTKKLIVKEITTGDIPVQCFTLEPTITKTFGSINLGKNTLSSNSISSNSNSFRKSSQTLPRSSILGQSFFEWDIASAYFTFLPNSIDSPISRVAVEATINNEERAGCCQFEKEFLCFYPGSSSSFNTDINRMKISNISCTDGANSYTLILTEITSNLKAELEFNSETDMLVFQNYFDIYKQALKTWGKNIDALMNVKRVSQVVFDMIKSPGIIIPTLRNTAVQTNG